jgi:hypothetical protein
MKQLQWKSSNVFYRSKWTFFKSIFRMWWKWWFFRNYDHEKVGERHFKINDWI